MKSQELVAEVVLHMRRAEVEQRGKLDVAALRPAGITAMKANPASPYARQHFGERSMVHGLLDALAECIRSGVGFAAAHPERAADMPKEHVERYETALTQAL